FSAADEAVATSNVNGEEIDLELRLEVAQMVRTIAKAKNELAQIKHPDAEDDRIEQASTELDAIVMATERATNTILEATETIEKDLTQIAALAHEDEDIMTLTDKIAAQTTGILEACNFQDITGQRINKVITTMQFIEERIRKMIEIWGFDAFSELPVPISSDPKSEDYDPDADLLAGPQLEGQGISQAEIDALFD
ncbi:MAG: protein phosphatase CheZ, partial [Alphaproteobacteria bacterium]|nr:protein phosphatase CheZ [Alphaproteobacteria bacterium]